MRKWLPLSFALVLGIGAEAANLSIAKRITTQLGLATYPLGTPSNLFYSAFPLPGAGYLLVGPPAVGTNWIWQRFGPSNELVWSNSFSLPSPSSVVELDTGELACLVPDYPYPNSRQIYVINTSGDAIIGYTLPEPAVGVSYWETLSYRSLLLQPDGLLVSGYAYRFDSYRSNFVMKVLTTNFAKIWQRNYGMFNYRRWMANLYRKPGGEYFLAYDDAGSTWRGDNFASVSTNGITDWDIRLGGNATAGGEDILVALIFCMDRGVLIGFTSSTANGWNKSAPYYGLDDIWLVKLDKDGQMLWDRSYGGSGSEQLCGIQQTEDGGFLVAGQTWNSQVSGNKSVDGNGIWLLKLNDRGFKESESVLSCDSTYSVNLLPAQNGYRLAAASWVADLSVQRVVDIRASSTGTAFQMDYSYDLQSWTPFLSRFIGNITFVEEIDSQQKFYRCVEVP